MPLMRFVGTSLLTPVVFAAWPYRSLATQNIMFSCFVLVMGVGGVLHTSSYLVGITPSFRKHSREAQPTYDLLVLVY